MNKKGQTRQDNSMAVSVAILAIVSIVILYFLSKLFFAVGIGAIALSLILLLVGFSNEEEQMVKIGFIGLIVGIVLALIGASMLGFFHNTEVGKSSLEFADAGINAGKDIINGYSEMNNVVTDAKVESVNSVRNLQKIEVTHSIPTS